MMDAGYLEGAVEKNAQIVETDYWYQPRALAELDAVMMICLFTWPVSLFILFMMWKKKVTSKQMTLSWNVSEDEHPLLKC